MNRLKLSTWLFAFVFAMGVTALAHALSLDQAKGSGLVGEKPDGYLGVVQASPEVEKLVQDINRQRAEKYKQIAAKNGTALAAVETLAGKKAIEITPPGQYVQAASGEWVRK